MWFFYIVAIIPLIVGLFLWIFHRSITWAEWLGCSVVGLITATIMHGIAFCNMTSDIETWSGQIQYVAHYPQWIEEYKVAIYRTETYSTGSGKNRQTHTRRVFSHYETRHDTHHEHWIAHIDYGEISDTINIDQAFYKQVVVNFGGVVEIGSKQRCSHSGGHFDGGDNNTYVTHNKTDYIYPSTTLRRFENRIKAAPSTFSFAKVPTNIAVYTWPQNPTWQVSERVMGSANRFVSTLEWDRMNSRLGPIKYINVIIVGFENGDSSLGQWQEAKWIGGKKNDVVICFGNTKTNINWVYCFGWTEKADCKRNLETIVLNSLNKSNSISLIEAEIRKHYIIKDWSKFDYITIEPPNWSYWVYIILLICTQSGLWFWCHHNEFEKERE